MLHARIASRSYVVVVVVCYCTRVRDINYYHDTYNIVHHNAFTKRIQPNRFRANSRAVSTASACVNLVAYLMCFSCVHGLNIHSRGAVC